MEQELYGLKELYDVTLKATYPIDIGKRKIEPDEIILAFDNIQIAGLHEAKQRWDARGGWDNRSHVSWEITRELPLHFTQGVFSLEHLAMISNSKLIEVEENNESILISQKESLESDAHGIISLKHIPAGQIFVYNIENNNKISFQAEGNMLHINQPYLDVLVTYVYEYMRGARIIKIGNRLLNGYLKLEAKTRLKEDKDGRTVTGIIHIPKLKLVSDLSMTLGKLADPVTVNFSAIGIPVGNRGASYVCDLFTLNDDIDSDM